MELDWLDRCHSADYGCCRLMPGLCRARPLVLTVPRPAALTAQALFNIEGDCNAKLA